MGIVIRSRVITGASSALIYLLFSLNAANALMTTSIPVSRSRKKKSWMNIKHSRSLFSYKISVPRIIRDQAPGGKHPILTLGFRISVLCVEGSVL